MVKKAKRPDCNLNVHYDAVLGDISSVIDAARKSAARSANCIMTAAYWLIGRRIVESEQKGEKRAAYGEELLERLSVDLGQRFGRGFGVDNLQRFRSFYLIYPSERIYATLSRKSGLEDRRGKKYENAGDYQLRNHGHSGLLSRLKAFQAVLLHIPPDPYLLAHIPRCVVQSANKPPS